MIDSRFGRSKRWTENVLVERPEQMHIGGTLHHYRKANPSIPNIDRLMKGSKPRIAITRTRGGIGDVLMTLPTVKAIAKKYDIKVTYGTDFRYLGGALKKVLIGNPYIEEIVKWQDVDFDQFDATIDLTCPCVAYEQPRVPPVNRVDLFARHCHVHLDDHHIDLILSEEELREAHNYIVSNSLSGKRLILVQTTSSTNQRDVPRDKMMRSLIDLVNRDRTIRVLLITHDSDHTPLETPYNELHRFHNMDTRQIAAIMSFCELVICPDSAVLHVAAAMKTKTLTIFGPTDPRARINYHPEAIAIWPAYNLPGYPIWYEASTDGWLCWKKLDSNLITETSIAIMNRTPISPTQELITFGQYERLSE